jgi:hypothetical protein
LSREKKRENLENIKTNKWKNFNKEVVEDGLELGQKGLDMINKQKTVTHRWDK